MSTLRYLQPFLARYRSMLVFGLVCALVSAVVSILGPYILRLAIDDIQARGVDIAMLLRYAGLILLIAVVDGLFKFGMRRLIIGASYNIERDLRSEALRAAPHTLQSKRQGAFRPAHACPQQSPAAPAERGTGRQHQ